MGSGRSKLYSSGQRHCSTDTDPTRTPGWSKFRPVTGECIGKRRGKCSGILWVWNELGKLGSKHHSIYSFRQRSSFSFIDWAESGDDLFLPGLGGKQCRSFKWQFNFPGSALWLASTKRCRFQNYWFDRTGNRYPRGECDGLCRLESGQHNSIRRTGRLHYLRWSWWNGFPESFHTFAMV